MTSASSMHEAGHSKLVLWDNPAGWGGEGVRRGGSGWGNTCTLMFIVVLFIIARTWKQPRCPLADEWIRKLCGTYIQ